MMIAVNLEVNVLFSMGLTCLLTAMRCAEIYDVIVLYTSFTC